MTERGILMTPENYGKCADGSKTKTRRIIEPQPVGEPRPLIEWSRGIATTCGDTCPDPDDLAAHAARLHGKIFPFTTKHGGLMSPKCPYGTVGDRLYVKEAWAADRCYDHCTPSEIPASAPFYYRNGIGKVFTRGHHKIRSPLFMLKRAARLWLELTEVRVERVQEITEADAFAEGIEKEDRRQSAVTTLLRFRRLWDSVNGKGAWERNDWVWCLSFRRIKP